MQEDNRKTSGDGLDDYIQVSSPGLRIIVGALSLVLVATVAWGFIGKIPVTTTVTGCVVDSQRLALELAQGDDTGHDVFAGSWVICFVDSSQYSAEQIEQFVGANHIGAAHHIRRNVQILSAFQHVGIGFVRDYCGNLNRIGMREVFHYVFGVRA